MTDQDYHDLAGYRQLAARVRERWTYFLETRRALLAAEERFGSVAEKASENVVNALLTEVLDWRPQDLNWQLDHADLVVTRNYMKYLVVETKRPGLLRGYGRARDEAFAQVRRYADKQGIRHVAVSDGHLFHAADVQDGGLRPRAVIDLEASAPLVEHLWWISVDGIYRDAPLAEPLARAEQDTQTEMARQGGLFSDQESSELLHPKHHLPARCFAYVGHAADPHTWRLPYRSTSGKLDLRRLPMAIQALLSNYRGAKVEGIPDAEIPAVMRRLAAAAREAGKMPDQRPTTAQAYKQLAAALAQLPPDSSS